MARLTLDASKVEARQGMLMIVLESEQTHVQVMPLERLGALVRHERPIVAKVYFVERRDDRTDFDASMLVATSDLYRVVRNKRCLEETLTPVAFIE